MHLVGFHYGVKNARTMQYIKTDLGRFITRCWVEYLDPEGSMELQEVDLHNELRRLYT